MNKDDSMKIRSQWRKKLFTMFISMIGAQPLDFFETEGKASFLLDKDDFYQLKKSGLHKLKSISDKVGKDIEIVVYSDDLNEFVENLFRPADVDRINRQKRGEKDILQVYISPWDKGAALGRKSYKLYRARRFLKRQFGIDSVKIL